MMAFQFKNFNNFRWMFDRLKQDIEVTVPVSDHKPTAKDFDSTGTPKKQFSDVQKLCEPIVKSTTNTWTSPGTEFLAEGGGTVEVAQMQWVSLHPDFPRGTRVHVIASNHDYEVESFTPDEVAGLTTYYLKAVTK